MAAPSQRPLPETRARSGFVCAWCRSPLSSRAARPAESAVNFGICRSCLERELERELDREGARSERDGDDRVRRGPRKRAGRVTALT
jgi:hypothetical protein